MMNPISSSGNIIYPPGINITNVKEVESLVRSGEIIYDNAFEQPLPSLVEASFNKESNSIKLKALFFVESEETLSSVEINQLFSISNFGSCKLQFFIYCSELEISRLNTNKIAGKYKAYTVEFSTENTSDFPKGLVLEDIKIVQTFVWNIDPKTSRGTETTVQTTD